MKTRGDLFHFQKRAIDFLKNTGNCALWADMGLGKTVDGATAFADLKETFEARSALVVAPKRVARKVWCDEVDEWGHLSWLGVMPILGSPEQRLRAIATPADIHTISRDSFDWLVEQFIHDKKQVKRWPWDTVILDESQGFKTQGTKRWKAAYKVRPLVNRIIQLTGTPIPNGYADLWAQMKLLDGGERLGTSEKQFQERWFEREMGDGYVTWHIKPHSAVEIQRLLSDIVLSMKVEDYFDLPPVMFNPILVHLDAKQMAVYRKMASKYIMETCSGKKVTAANAAVCNGKLLQLANGSIYVDEKGNFDLFHDEKIDALIETLDGLDGPVMIGYQFTADTKRIGVALTKYCAERKKRWAIADSDEDLNAFAAGTLDYLVLHPASAGHGLNDMHLSGALNIVWFGLTANLEWFQQLNARLTGGIRRLGKNIVVHMILAHGTIDMRWRDLLTQKGASQDDLTRALVMMSNEGNV